MTDSAPRDVRGHDPAGGGPPEEADRADAQAPVGRLVRWLGGASSPRALRGLVYTEDTVVVALLDSVGAFIHRAFPPAGTSEPPLAWPVRRGRKVLAVAAELRGLADFLRRTHRSLDSSAEAAHGTLASVAVEKARVLEGIAAELERAALEALGGDPPPATGILEDRTDEPNRVVDGK